MSFDLRTLELFIRVAALGAVGKAGREFRMSPTTATQRIKGLELELGVTLFNRTTRAVALSTDGDIFLNHAKRIVASMEDARSDLSGGTVNIKGELRVAGSASFGRRYVAPYIAEFLREYPETGINLLQWEDIETLIHTWSKNPSNLNGRREKAWRRAKSQLNWELEAEAHVARIATMLNP